jgi:uncharacterized membrane protein
MLGLLSHSDRGQGRVAHHDRRKYKKKRKGAIEMIRLEKSVVINRPLGEVFEYVANFEDYPQWATEVVEAKKTSEGPLGVGTTYTHFVQVLGQRIESGYEVTEYEPNRKVSMKSTSGPIPTEVDIIVESVENWPSHSSPACWTDSGIPMPAT